MKIRFICVGKLANAPIKAIVEDYRKRIERLCDLEIIEVKDAEAKDGSARLQREAERIRAIAEPFSECILWDETGEAQTSPGFSKFLDKMENKATKRITFIMGSSHGVADEIKAAVPRKFQLSQFTLTHEWARALALEQIYRAFCIKRNLPYHH